MITSSVTVCQEMSPKSGVTKSMLCLHQCLYRCRAPKFTGWPTRVCPSMSKAELKNASVAVSSKLRGGGGRHPHEDSIGRFFIDDSMCQETGALRRVRMYDGRFV